MRSTPYLIPGLLALFVVAVGAWFVLRAGPDEATAPAAAPAPAAGAVPRAPGLPKNPFLTTHEPAPTFLPDGGNVAPSFHVEMEDLKRRLAEAPEDTAALLRMARLSQDGHQSEEAVGYYRRYLALHPEGRQAWLDLAQTLGQLQQWDAAREATEAMLRQFPNDPAALYNLGAVHANAGRLGEARATWQRVAAQTQDPAMKTMAETALQRLDSMHP